jgi:hypothetical protein
MGQPEAVFDGAWNTPVGFDMMGTEHGYTPPFSS